MVKIHCIAIVVAFGVGLAVSGAVAQPTGARSTVFANDATPVMVAAKKPARLSVGRMQSKMRSASARLARTTRFLCSGQTNPGWACYLQGGSCCCSNGYEDFCIGWPVE